MSKKNLRDQFVGVRMLSKRFKALQFTVEQREAILTLIANMVVTEDDIQHGVDSRWGEQGVYKLNYEYLPKNMEFEREIVQLLERMHRDSVPATYERLLMRLKLQYGDQAEQKLNDLLAWRNESNPDVISIAYSLADWMTFQKMVVALDVAKERATGMADKPEKAFSEIMQILTASAPSGSMEPARDLEDLMVYGRAHQAELESRLDAGLTAGPTLPWENMREKIPVLQIGDMITWVAKSGHGKTSLALLLAKWWAWTCGYDVALFHLETEPEDLYQRLMANEMTVLPSDLQVPKVVRQDRSPWKQRFDDIEAKFIKNQAENGKIRFYYRAGITLTQMRAEIAEAKALADARGRELVVIVDYYTEIDGSELGKDNDASTNNALADQLKLIASSNETKCLMCNFAQADNNTNFSNRRTPFNGQKIFMRSQIFILIDRDIEADYNMALTDKTGAIQKDALGREMYCHRIGEPDSEGRFIIAKVNKGKTGRCGFTAVNGYFQFLERDLTDDEIEQINPKKRKSKKQPDFPGGDIPF